jgi:hypothetical protein
MSTRKTHLFRGGFLILFVITYNSCTMKTLGLIPLLIGKSLFIRPKSLCNRTPALSFVDFDFVVVLLFHSPKITESQIRSIANRKKDFFSFLLTTHHGGDTLGAWGGYAFLLVRTKAQRAVPPPAFSVQRKLALVNAFF